VKYIGTVPVDARFILYIYEGSVLPTPGRLLATYEKIERFEPGEERKLVFEHQTVSTWEARRDIGLEAFRNAERIYSGEWDDRYFVVSPARQMIPLMLMMLPLVLLMIIMRAVK